MTGRARRIDVHHHIYPREFTRHNLPAILADAPGYPAAIYTDWSAGQTLAFMDAHAIDVVVASMTSPGLWLGDPGESREAAREFNELAAQLMQDHPGRFGAFAAIPLPDAAASFAEIAHALDRLRLNGIGLMSSYDGRLLGDPAFVPVFDELNRRRAAVFVHPIANANSRIENPWLIAPILEFPFDTTRTIVSLIASGTLTRCPDIRFIFPHAGGTVITLAARIEGALRRHLGAEQISVALPHGMAGALARLHFDVISATNPVTMAAVRMVVPPGHLLLGTDHPFVPAAVTLDHLGDLGFSEAELEGITSTNALAILMNAERLSAIH